jgi:hypothetical protein
MKNGSVVVTLILGKEALSAVFGLAIRKVATTRQYLPVDIVSAGLKIPSKN